MNYPVGTLRLAKSGGQMDFERGGPLKFEAVAHAGRFHLFKRLAKEELKRGQRISFSPLCRENHNTHFKIWAVLRGVQVDFTHGRI